MNISLKSKVRHWFNFYRLALESRNPIIQENLAKSEGFYKKWGDVKNVSFEDWWKLHSNLFHERQLFEILEGAFKTDRDYLYLKVPMSSSAIPASKIFTRIYREELEKRLGSKSKVKKRYFGEYQVTPLEFQVVNFRYYWIFADKVYSPLFQKIGKSPMTKDLVLLAKEKFKSQAERTQKRSKEVAKQRIAPFRQSIEDDYETLSRTATRYRLITENLLLNVSNGVFPGDYQEEGLKNLATKRKELKPKTEPKKAGRKRIARPKGYVKTQKIEDQDNPNKRKMIVK